LVSLSYNTWKSYLLSAINLVTSSSFLGSVSQVSTKTNCTLGSFLYLVTIFCIAGNDALQGPHQVAQKSTITTLPFNDASDTSLPLVSFSAKPLAFRLSICSITSALA